MKQTMIRTFTPADVHAIRQTAQLFADSPRWIEEVMLIHDLSRSQAFFTVECGELPNFFVSMYLPVIEVWMTAEDIKSLIVRELEG